MAGEAGVGDLGQTWVLPGISTQRVKAENTCLGVCQTGWMLHRDRHGAGSPGKEGWPEGQVRGGRQSAGCELRIRELKVQEPLQVLEQGGPGWGPQCAGAGAVTGEGAAGRV